MTFLRQSDSIVLRNNPGENMEHKISDIIKRFNLDFRIQPYGNGHINDTYIAGSAGSKYIIQRINSSVFKRPEQVMENIESVCDFLKEKITAAGGDPDRETLTLIRTTDGKSYYKTEDNQYFRVYKFISDAYTADIPESPEQLCAAAHAFGRFQRMLSDYPAEKLNETIKDFHNTVKRYGDFEAAVSADRMKRLESVKSEAEFVRVRKNISGLITDGIRNGSIPVRVTHNDTKFNNVMLDAKTGEGICVIDLDTVMPGSLLYDFGDALRTGANTAAEDERDLSLVHFDLGMFEAFSRGFISEVKDTLTQAEIRLLPMSAAIMTYECGMRFLTDYLEGDIYFKIHRRNHNLDRARNQFKLMLDIESKLNDMTEIVKRILESD